MTTLSKNQLATIERRRKAALKRREIINHLKQIENIDDSNTLVLILASNKPKEHLKLPIRLRSYRHKSNIDKATRHSSGCQYLYRQEKEARRTKLAKRYQNPFLLP